MVTDQNKMYAIGSSQNYMTLQVYHYDPVKDDWSQISMAYSPMNRILFTASSMANDTVQVSFFFVMGDFFPLSFCSFSHLWRFFFLLFTRCLVGDCRVAV